MDPVWKGTCQRCHKVSSCHSMSWFNTQLICPDCGKQEAKDPNIQAAKQAELKEVQQGNYNFQGIYERV